jgi:methionyl-tRNA synthetase
MSTTTAQHDYQGTECHHLNCQQARGYQCEDCGHYFPRNQIRDDNGAYYCRDNVGHEKEGR